MKYFISQKAGRDIENIWLYTLDNWSIEQADRYFNLIMDEIEYLAENPISGQDYGFVKKGYFRSKIKSHFIFYRIISGGKGIEVIRVLHQRMDLIDKLTD